MKKGFLIVAMIAFVAVSTIACKEEKKEHSKEHAELVYACPMECEDDKTYTDKDAKCPVCKMKLVAQNAEGKYQGHDKDGHH